MKQKPKLKIISVLAVCLLCALFCGFIGPTNLAANVKIGGILGSMNDRTAETSVKSAALGARPSVTYVSVYVDGEQRGSALLIGGAPRMTLKGFADAMGLEFDGNVVGGIEINTAEDGSYIEALGRYFYISEDIYESSGLKYYPVSLLAKVFGASTAISADGVRLDIQTGVSEVIESGETYYDVSSLFWLSRIIYSEAGSEPFDGMIAVGNVVLNRVASESFPNTVKDVIFDTQYGVQFCPAENGSIYMEPSETAIIAAKLCLDGASVVGNSLYFVNPITGISDWFSSSRTFVASIGRHDFYA